MNNYENKLLVFNAHPGILACSYVLAAQGWFERSFFTILPLGPPGPSGLVRLGMVPLPLSFLGQAESQIWREGNGLSGERAIILQSN